LVQEYPDEYQPVQELMDQGCFLKFRDILYETVQEYSRKNEFIRIYPSKGSKMYDKYFSKNTLSKLIYKTLFTSEILSYDGQ